jgi:hypothetical protein
MMLINVEPTTLTGAAALLEYVAQHERRGDAWPDELEDDDGRATSFYRELCQNVAAVLSQSERA